MLQTDYYMKAFIRVGLFFPKYNPELLQLLSENPNPTHAEVSKSAFGRWIKKCGKMNKHNLRNEWEKTWCS